MNVVYVTGNQNKARYFSEIIGLDIEHMAADVAEIQSLDLKEVVSAKAVAAYKQLKRPVLVEDTSLVVAAMGKLPGTFIKWFLQEIGPEGVCRLADADHSRSAYASAMFAYYDGKNLQVFEGGMQGKLADHPKGSADFGWNPTFIPEGSDITLGEMEDDVFKRAYAQIKPLPALKQFLLSL